MSTQATDTPPATTTPPAEPPKPTELTDALRAEQHGAATEAMLGIPKKKKEETKKPDAPAAPAAPAAATPPAAPAATATPPATPAAPATPATPAPPEKKLNVRPAAKPAPQLSAEDVASIAARTAAEFQKQSAAATPAPQDDLPDDLKKMAPVYAEMERLFPEKYKGGIAKQIAKFRQLEVERADKWEAANPGKMYNAEDDEHASFYEKNQPRLDLDDIEEARFEVRYKQRAQRDIEPKLQEAQRTIHKMRAEPEARRLAADISTQITAAMLPEGTEANEANVKKWAESDPITADVSSEIAQSVQPVVYAVSTLWDGVENFDQANQSHVAARKLLADFEHELLQEDPAKLVDDEGRQWVPLSQYRGLTEQQRAYAFTTTKANLANYAKIRAAATAKAVAAQRKDYAEKMAVRLGYSKTPVPPVTPAVQPPTTSTAPVIKPSPSIGSGAPTPPSTGTAPAGAPASNDVVGKILGL